MSPDDREKLRSKCHSALSQNQGLVLVSATEILKLLDVDHGVDEEREMLWTKIHDQEEQIRKLIS